MVLRVGGENADGRGAGAPDAGVPVAGAPEGGAPEALSSAVGGGSEAVGPGAGGGSEAVGPGAGGGSEAVSSAAGGGSEAVGPGSDGQNVSPLVTVCADPDVAAALIGQGASVVFYGADAERLGEAITALRPGPGRVAVLIGDPADPDVEGAAGAMAAELFGGAAPVS